MSKRKQNNTKHVPIPISNKYMKNLKINLYEINPLETFLESFQRIHVKNI